MRAAIVVLVTLAACSPYVASEPPVTVPLATSASAQPPVITASTSVPHTENLASPAQRPDILVDPGKATERAPETFRAKFATSKGDIVVELHRDWAPHGVDRIYNLILAGFYDNARFFRVIKGFMAQFGIHADPQISTKWRNANLSDDKGKASNTRGTLTFATAGPDSRTTQLFFNFADNIRLDQMGFSPIGKIVEGLSTLDALNGKYGEGAPQGDGPEQGRLQAEGNTYLEKEFPDLDWIRSITIVR